MICSVHFEENCFTRAFDQTQRRQLKPGQTQHMGKKGAIYRKGFNETKSYEGEGAAKAYVLVGSSYVIHLRFHAQDV